MIEENLDLIFRALADKTRRRLLRLLSEKAAMVTELAGHFEISLPAVGKHLRVLENAGLIERTVSGRVHRCSLDASPLRNADQWLSYYQCFWDGSLDSLSDYFQNDAT